MQVSAGISSAASFPCRAAVDKAVPAELAVHIVCDHLATHETPAVNEWIARHPRFHAHFTPTGSSWINQVERWFAYLTTQMLQRGACKSVQALEGDVRDWVQQWNADLIPAGLSADIGHTWVG